MSTTSSEETSSVLTAFNIFHPDSSDRSVSTRKSHVNTLNDHYRNPHTDTHENKTVTGDYIIDKIKTKAEVDVDFFECIDTNMTKNEAFKHGKERGSHYSKREKNKAIRKY